MRGFFRDSIDSTPDLFDITVSDVIENVDDNNGIVVQSSHELRITRRRFVLGRILFGLFTIRRRWRACVSAASNEPLQRLYPSKGVLVEKLCEFMLLKANGSGRRRAGLGCSILRLQELNEHGGGDMEWIPWTAMSNGQRKPLIKTLEGALHFSTAVDVIRDSVVWFYSLLHT